METRIKLLAIVLVLAIAIPTGCIIYVQTTQHHDSGDTKYEFTTCEFCVGTNVVLPAFYEDSYFEKDATELNHDLMVFALALEMSTSFYTDDPSERPQSVLKLMKEIGCTETAITDTYTKEPTMTSVDIAVGSKPYTCSDGSEATLIFLALKGVRYSVEFGSNMLIGPEGPHEGFLMVRDQAIDFLSDYILEKNITGKVKILVTGYSRTGAGANLTAAYLSDAVYDGAVKERVGNIELTKESVYGFGFEVPNCGYYVPSSDYVPPTDPRYDNIWYVADSEDLVTYVPPASYDFVRYGHRVSTPSDDPEKKAMMLVAMKELYGEKSAEFYNLKFTKIGDVTNATQLIEGMIHNFFEAVGTREYYSENIESDFARTIYICIEKDGLVENLLNVTGGYIPLVYDLYRLSDDEAAFKEYFTEEISGMMKKRGCPDYTESIVNTLYQLTQVIVRYTHGNVFELIQDEYFLAMTVNIANTIKPHSPDMAFCYLIQNSSNYDYIFD